MKVKILEAANSKLVGLSYDLGQEIGKDGSYTIYQDMAVGYDMYRVSIFREGDSRVMLNLVPLDESKKDIIIDKIELIPSDKFELSIMEMSDVRRGLVIAMHELDAKKKPGDTQLSGRLEKIEVRINNWTMKD